MKQNKFDRFAALLAALLILTASACGSKEKTETSSGQEPSSSGASSAASMPQTPAEIVRYNDQISPDDVKLIQFEAPAGESKYATIKTGLGDIKLVLYSGEAPLAVENFITLAQDGFYNGMHFYEVFPEARISAGATDINGVTGKSASGGAFADEYSLNLWHFNGALAMNNGSVSGANDSRFYIVQNKKLPQETIDAMIDGGFPQKVIDKYLETGGLPACDFRDTVFGQVVEGMEVVEQIALAERDGQNKPKTQILIDSITIS